MLEKFRAERPDLCVDIVADTERQGSWPTYLRTLRATAGARHHLVLNDDITVCRDFLASVDKVIQARPGHIVSLYTNSPWVPTARARGQAWIEKSLVASPALIWPTALIHEAYLRLIDDKPAEWNSAVGCSVCSGRSRRR